MIKHQTAQTIERAARDVWAYVADIARHPVETAPAVVRATS